MQTAASRIQAEQARVRAEEEARKRREAEVQESTVSRGSGGGTVGGIICPFTPAVPNSPTPGERPVPEDAATTAPTCSPPGTNPYMQ